MHSQMIDISVSAWCLRRLNFLSYPLAMGKSECSLRRALEVISLVVPRRGKPDTTDYFVAAKSTKFAVDGHDFY